MDACKKKSIIVINEEEDEEEDRSAVNGSLQVEIGTKRPRRTRRNHFREMRDVYEYDTHFCNHSNAIMERAKKIQASLNPEFPCFIKLLHSSQVLIKSSYLRLPAKFCKQNKMPNNDESIVLVGENGEQHTVNFLAKHLIFSGGWKTFSLDHKLREGDVVVFQLVSPSQFKVYIVRRNDVSVDGELELPNSNINAKESHIAKSYLCLSSYAHTEQDTSFGVAKYPSENLTISGPFVDYKSFTITVNGFSLDSELSEGIRSKYYELCFSRKSYLHERLKTHNPRLAAEIIIETVSLADAIRSSGNFTSQDAFANWDTTLGGFELLGMDVDFLRSRLNQLRKLAVKCGNTDFMRCNEAKFELTELEKDVMTLETMMKRLKEGKNVLQEEDIMTFNTPLNRIKDAMNVLQSEIVTLNANIHAYELIFKDVAAAPWGS